MAVALVQTKTDSSTTNYVNGLTTSFTSDVSAGSLLLAFVAMSAGGYNPITGITDNNGGTWVQIQAGNTADRSGTLWACYDANAGPTTVYLSSGTNYVQYAAILREYSGAATSSALDVSNLVLDTTYVNTHAAALTTTTADDGLVGFYAGSVGTATHAAASGYGNYVNVAGDQTNASGVDGTATAAGGYTPGITSAGDYERGVFISAAFKPAGEPEPPTPLPALYTRTDTNLAVWANGLSAGTKKTRALWAAARPTFAYFGQDYSNWNSNLDILVDAATAANQTACLVLYSVPHRDNGEFSTGGSADYAAYVQFINDAAGIIGNRYALIALESDALAGITTLNSTQQAERKACIAYAITKIKSDCPNARVYVDAGHPDYGAPASNMEALLRDVDIENADGFVLNSSNYYPDAACETYGDALLALLDDLKGGQLGYIYDTSRNGVSYATPTYYANPAGRMFGVDPEYYDTETPGVHGKLWIKSPGESDGSNITEAPNPGILWPTYLWNDSVGDNVNPPGGSTDPTNTSFVLTTSGMLQREPAITGSGAPGGPVIKRFTGTEWVPVTMQVIS